MGSRLHLCRISPFPLRYKAEYWHLGPTIRIRGPLFHSPAPYPASPSTTPSSSITQPVHSPHATAPDVAAACRAASTPPYAWHTLFAVAAHAVRGSSAAPCPPASPSSAPQSLAVLVLAAAQALSDAWSDPGELRRVYPATALQVRLRPFQSPSRSRG